MTESLEEAPPPPAKLTGTQWDLICYCEEFWLEFKAFPSLDSIKKQMPVYRTDLDVEKDLFASHVRNRLTNRGIDYSVVLPPEDAEYKLPARRDRLTPVQLAAVAVLVNPFDRRSTSKKLSELGIRESTLNGWMKSERFSSYFRERSEELFSDGIPIAHSALMDRVTSGDMKAIKLFYEVSGRYTGINKQENANVTLVIVKLIEIIQKHCDSNTLFVINHEIEELMTNSSLTPPRLINGQVSSDSSFD